MIVLLQPQGFTDTDEKLTRILSNRHVSQAVFHLEFSSSDTFGPKLRRKPPEGRVYADQNFCTQIIYIVLQTSVRLF